MPCMCWAKPGEFSPAELYFESFKKVIFLFLFFKKFSRLSLNSIVQTSIEPMILLPQSADIWKFLPFPPGSAKSNGLDCVVGT